MAAHAGGALDRLDRVASLVPAVRALFTARFGKAKIASGGELTSIAHGPALVAQQDDLSAWTA